MSNKNKPDAIKQALIVLTGCAELHTESGNAICKVFPADKNGNVDFTACAKLGHSAITELEALRASHARLLEGLKRVVDNVPDDYPCIRNARAAITQAEAIK